MQYACSILIRSVGKVNTKLYTFKAANIKCADQVVSNVKGDLFLCRSQPMRALI